VRVAGEQGVELDTYGRSSGFCIDPIEKKPLYHFLPGTPVLSFGTAGCNLGCRFCQNWDLSRAREADRLQAAASPQAIAASAASHDCASVAFTYNEPIIFAEYAIDAARACHERGVYTVAVSAGYISEGPREEFFGVMDAANIDLKAFSEDFYQRLCGASLQPVLDTLRHLARETRVHLEITTLLVPGENDSAAELEALCGFVALELGSEVPLHFSAFHPAWRMQEKPRTPVATLRRARRIARQAGLDYVYLGNVRDQEGGSTWCPSCGTLLIERRGYQLGAWGLRGAACAACGHTVPGRFADGPGHWGPRRQRVSPT